MAKGKYQRLYDLEEENLLKIEALIRQGASHRSVAERLHQLGHLQDVPLKSLERLLASYQKDVMDRALMRTIDEAGILKATRAAAKINLLDEMLVAVAAQRGRFEKALEMAEKTPQLLIEQHGREGERYLKMLGDTVKIQMDIGIIPKVPRKVTGQLMRDADNPNVVRFELTEGVADAVAQVEEMFPEEFDDAVLTLQ